MSTRRGDASDVLGARDKYAAENYEAALIYKSDPVRYAGVFQEYARLVLAKPAPVRAKRGEQISLIREEEVA
jgi:hypothetical protein